MEAPFVVIETEDTKEIVDQTWEAWRDVDPHADIGPINEVVTPQVIVQFSDDEKTSSIYVKRGESKPTLRFGTKEPKFIKIDDPLVPEIACLDSRTFCETAAYVTDCAQAVSLYDSAAKLTVTQDYERVIEAMRIRAAQGNTNITEADSVFAMYSQVVRESAAEASLLRRELPA